jgi:hypothetical protein
MAVVAATASQVTAAVENTGGAARGATRGVVLFEETGGRFQWSRLKA